MDAPRLKLPDYQRNNEIRRFENMKKAEEILIQICKSIHLERGKILLRLLRNRREYQALNLTI